MAATGMGAGTCTLLTSPLAWALPHFLDTKAEEVRPGSALPGAPFPSQTVRSHSPKPVSLLPRVGRVLTCAPGYAPTTPRDWHRWHTSVPHADPEEKKCDWNRKQTVIEPSWAGLLDPVDTHDLALALVGHVMPR